MFKCIQLSKPLFFIALPQDNKVLQLIYSYFLILCGLAWKTEEKGGQKSIFYFLFEGLPLKMNGLWFDEKKAGIGIGSQMETGRVKP